MGVPVGTPICLLSRPKVFSPSDVGGPDPDASGDHRLDHTTNIEVTQNFHPDGLHDGGQVVENAIHGALVEDAVVAKAPEVELEALQFDADSTGDVGDVHRRKVRSTTLELRQLGGVRFDAA